MRLIKRTLLQYLDEEKFCFVSFVKTLVRTSRIGQSRLVRPYLEYAKQDWPPYMKTHNYILILKTEKLCWPTLLYCENTSYTRNGY